MSHRAGDRWHPADSMRNVDDESERYRTTGELDVMDTMAARCLIPTEEPCQVAVDAMSALMPLLETEPHAGALYSIWGDLSDSIDLGVKSRDEAGGQIRLMAREWLDVRSDSGDVSGFIDRWYLELGLRRI
jgi:hypothetical protein